jgi:hypothetical protein
MPLFLYRRPKTGYRVQGFASEDTSEDHHVYEPVTCPVCQQIHHGIRPRGPSWEKRSNRSRLSLPASFMYGGSGVVIISYTFP